MPKKNLAKTLFNRLPECQKQNFYCTLDKHKGSDSFKANNAIILRPKHVPKQNKKLENPKVPSEK